MPKKFIKPISLLLCFCFFFTQTGLAQLLPQPLLVPLQLPVLRYLSVNTANPSNYFNFLLDRGQRTEDGGQRIELNQEAKKLIHYFFLGITLPSEAFWVNLKPQEPERITSEELSKTDLGRTLLEQDLKLKKDMAKYLHPHNPQGKLYWEKLYQALEHEGRKASATNRGGPAKNNGWKKATITSSNRVWIVPAEAVVLETEDGALVARAQLKVLLESEYLSLKEKRWNKEVEAKSEVRDEIKHISESLMKEIILPALTKEINESPGYAPLRQVYHSLILAEWYKRKHNQRTEDRSQKTEDGKTEKLKNEGTSPYASYINSGTTTGLESELPWEKQAIWQEYLKSYQEGEYNLQDTIFGLKRMYFSGGIAFFGESGIGVSGGSPIITKKLLEPPRNNPGETLATAIGTEPGNTEIKVITVGEAPNLPDKDPISSISKPIQEKGASKTVAASPISPKPGISLKELLKLFLDHKIMDDHVKNTLRNLLDKEDIDSLREVEEVIKALSELSDKEKKPLYFINLLSCWLDTEKGFLNRKFIPPQESAFINAFIKDVSWTKKSLYIRERIVEVLSYLRKSLSLSDEEWKPILFKGIMEGLLYEKNPYSTHTANADFVFDEGYIDDLKLKVGIENIAAAFDAVLAHEIMHNILNNTGVFSNKAGALHEFVADVAANAYLESINRQDLIFYRQEFLGYSESTEEVEKQIFFAAGVHPAARAQLFWIEKILNYKGYPINWGVFLSTTFDILEKRKSFLESQVDSSNYLKYLAESVLIEYIEKVSPKEGFHTLKIIPYNKRLPGYLSFKDTPPFQFRISPDGVARVEMRSFVSSFDMLNSILEKDIIEKYPYLLGDYFIFLKTEGIIGKESEVLFENGDGSNLPSAGSPAVEESGSASTEQASGSEARRSASSAVTTMQRQRFAFKEEDDDKTVFFAHGMRLLELSLEGIKATLENVKKFGLLSSEELDKQGFKPNSSWDKEYRDLVHGVVINPKIGPIEDLGNGLLRISTDAGYATIKGSRDMTFSEIQKAILEQALYGKMTSGAAILPVLAERSDEAYEDFARISESQVEKRLENSVIFLVDFNKLKIGQVYSQLEVGVEGVIDLKDIKYILVPAQIYPIAREVFKEEEIKVVSIETKVEKELPIIRKTLIPAHPEVGINNPFEYTGLKETALAMPDYEKELLTIISSQAKFQYSLKDNFSQLIVALNDMLLPKFDIYNYLQPNPLMNRAVELYENRDNFLPIFKNTFLKTTVMLPLLVPPVFKLEDLARLDWAQLTNPIKIIENEGKGITFIKDIKLIPLIKELGINEEDIKRVKKTFSAALENERNAYRATTADLEHPVTRGAIYRNALRYAAKELGIEPTELAEQLLPVVKDSEKRILEDFLKVNSGITPGSPAVQSASTEQASGSEARRSASSALSNSKLTDEIASPRDSVGARNDDTKGGIDLSQIELTLKDDKYISSLNPADIKILRAAKALKEEWNSLSLLYIHELILLLKDNLASEIQNKNLLSQVLRQLQSQKFLDPQAIQFLNFIQANKPLSEVKLALLN